MFVYQDVYHLFGCSLPFFFVFFWFLINSIESGFVIANSIYTNVSMPTLIMNCVKDSVKSVLLLSTNLFLLVFRRIPFRYYHTLPKVSPPRFLFDPSSIDSPLSFSTLPLVLRLTLFGPWSLCSLLAAMLHHFMQALCCVIV